MQRGLNGDSLNRNAAQAAMCNTCEGDKFQGLKTKEDDAENPTWLRSFHSSLRTLK